MFYPKLEAGAVELASWVLTDAVIVDLWIIVDSSTIASENMPAMINRDVRAPKLV